MPLSTRVKRSFCSAVALPVNMVRVMSVVPLRYCAPESTSINSPGFSVRLDFSSTR